MQQWDAGKKAGELEVFRFDKRCGLELKEEKEPIAELTSRNLMISLVCKKKKSKSRYMYKRRVMAIENESGHLS